ncbi:glycosyltransferase [Enterococcus cecorum]|nr:glycosyltransferase [Enterococcus cecorum]
MKKVKISIIVPVYNVEKYIKRCVDSLINQSYDNLEIILIDDGSLDNSSKICDEYSLIDKRIKVIHKENGGLSDARNAGLFSSSGDYILYVDSDDYIEKDACLRFVNNIEESIDIIAGAYREVNESKINLMKHTNLKEGKIYSAKNFVINSICKNEWYAPAWLNLYRREFLVNNNLYFKKGILFEDMEILPKIFLSNPKVKYLDYPFYNYMIRSNSIMTSEHTEEKVVMSLSIFSSWYNLFNQIEDKEYQRYLYGVLIRYYLANARKRNITGWKSQNLNFLFSIKYSLNLKDKIKVILFSLMPRIYCKL